MAARIVTCVAPVNIAVIKYWGKSDEELIIPINDSISLTLSTDNLCATTSIVASPDFTEDKFWLNGKEESMQSKRIQNCFTAFREAAKTQGSVVDSSWKVRICSKNNFPTAAGLASSAAGYACLVAALQNLYKLEGNFSSVARKGSGSACRSMFGGFVQWQKGSCSDGSDSLAVELFPNTFWPEIRVLICVVNDEKKDTGSTSGMQRSVQTSELLRYRAESIVPRRIDEMRNAIEEKNFDAFARLTMQDSNQLHATCQDTYPPIRYMAQTSWDIVSLVHRYNEACGINRLAYTFDAGPNAFLFCLDENVPEILRMLVTEFPSDEQNYVRGIYTNADLEQVAIPISCGQQSRKGSLKYIITTKAGTGPLVVDEHLFDDNFQPRA